MQYPLVPQTRFIATTVPFGLLLCLSAVMASAALAAEVETDTAQDRLITLDGSVVSGNITSITAGRVVVVSGRDKPLELNRLRRIQRPDLPSDGPGSANRRAGKVVVRLLGGGQLHAQAVTIVEDQCSIRWPFTDTLLLPIDAISAIRLDGAQADPQFLQALGRDRDDFDQLFVKVDGKLQWINGFIERLDEASIHFQWQEKQHVLPRSAVYGIILALIGRAPDRTGQCFVELRDGSSVWGKIVTLTRANDTFSSTAELTLCVSRDVNVKLPWDQVTRVTVCSDLLVYLSDLTPVDVEEQPIVALPRSWQRDKNVTGRPLQLARRVYSKGIGVEARSRLSFNAAQKYQRLVATIGIDAAAGERGDCEFVVLGDGKELFRRRMRATDSPYHVRVDVGGMNQVTLLVEPGEDLDFGDHADWCEVCFLRKASTPKSENN